MSADIVVIGNALIDVLANPVNESVFDIGSLPVKDIKLAFGGDALNESVILAHFGKQVDIITKVGQDDAGARVCDYLKSAKVNTESIIFSSDVNTSINIVLVDEKGQRHFLTNPEGSQRKLTYSDIKPYLNIENKIVSMASIFISPLLGIEDMTKMFRYVKETLNCIVAVDMTKAKNGETLDDLREFLPYIDYIFPNEEEIALLTGINDPYINAKKLVDMGVKHAVVKCGRNGCIICYENKLIHIPAYSVEKCVDTTGAGDCFAAGFLWALSEGWKPYECGCFCMCDGFMCS